VSPSPAVPATTTLLTVEQAAEALAVGRSTLYQLLQAGRLRSVKIGRCRRIPRQSLDEFVRGLASEPDTGGRAASPSPSVPARAQSDAGSFPASA